MTYRLLISSPYHDWEEHFEELAEAETRMERLQAFSVRHHLYCNLTLLQTVADITVNGKELIP